MIHNSERSTRQCACIWSDNLLVIMVAMNIMVVRIVMVMVIIHAKPNLAFRLILFGFFFSFGKIQLLILCNSGLMKQNMTPSPARERTPTVRRPSTPDMRETNISWVASGSVQWPAVETKRPRPDELLSTPGCTKEKRQRLSGWRLPLEICLRAMRIFEL